MSIRMIGAGFCVLICTASIVLAQSRREQVQSRNSDPIPISIAPKLKAIFLQRVALDAAAKVALEAGDYAEAEMNARQAVSLTKGDGEGQEILAAALDAQGKTQQALQAYKVLFDEGDVTPYNELPYSQLLLKTGHWAEAVETYNKQLPYLSNGDLLQAHSNFSSDEPRPTELATAIHIGLGLTTGWRGYHGTYQDSIKQEQEQFEQAMALSPSSSVANYYIGYGLNRLGRHDEARAAFQKAAALDSDGGVKAAAEKALSGR